MAGKKPSRAHLKRPNGATIIQDDELDLEAKIDQLCQAIMASVKPRVIALVRSANERLASKLADAEDELARARQDLRDKEEQLRTVVSGVDLILEAQKKEGLLLQQLRLLHANNSSFTSTPVGSYYPATAGAILVRTGERRRQRESENARSSSSPSRRKKCKSSNRARPDEEADRIAAKRPPGGGSGGLAGYYCYHLGGDGDGGTTYQFVSASSASYLEMPTKTKLKHGGIITTASGRSREGLHQRRHPKRKKDRS